MPENRFPCSTTGAGRETVSIEANRIMDACKDRDCFENVRVFLTECGNEVIEHTASVRVKGASIAWVYIGIDPVAFNRGFYTVTVRFFVKISFEACLGHGRSQEFEGITAVEKRVILYGSESSVSVFRSDPEAYDFCAPLAPAGAPKGVPVAVVETVEPIVLGARVVEERAVCECAPCCCCCSCHDIPEFVSCRVDGSLTDGCPNGHVLLVSFGIFSIIRLIRPAQYLISASEYVIPDKECISAGEDDPCAIFRSMAFPTREFSPPAFPPPPPQERVGKCGC